MPDTSPSTYRILVVANETCPCPGLQDEIRARAEGQDASVFIVTPALNKRLKHWVSDVDEALEAARQRLDAIVDNLRADGVEVEGQVGDSRPLQAIEDALADRSVDELLISTHPPGRSHWLEKGVVEQAAERFDFPVTHYVSIYGAQPVA